MLNTDKFEQALYEEGKAAFSKIIEDRSDGLYVIGICHSGGWDSVMPMFNTLNDLLLLQKIRDDDDQKEYENRVKWDPSDFPALEEYHEYFTRSTEQLQMLREQFDDLVEDYQTPWQETLDAMVRVLNKLDKEGVFSQGVERDSLVVYIAAYDEDFDERFSFVKRLNSIPVIESVTEEFEYLIALHAKWEREALDEILGDTL